MRKQENQSFLDPKSILKSALEELDLFSQAAEDSLEVGESGQLKASRKTRLERVVGLARDYIGSLFSEHKRREKSKKMGDLKEAVLNARDIIQSHSELIIKFKEGDEQQQKLAEYALAAIQRYNNLVSLSEKHYRAHYDVYNYERKQLLSDQEIRGKTIELPQHHLIKFDSRSEAHPAHRMFQEISQSFPFRSISKTTASISLTHKKSLQFMIDTFHMKSLRMMREHLSHHNSMAEILSLIKKSPLGIDQESNPELISMQQQLEVGSGFSIQVSGCFKQNPSDPKFLAMPLIDSFRLRFQISHSGFPYSSQHTGWALSEQWVEATPLRPTQTPIYQEIDYRRKRLASRLLRDQDFILMARKRARLKREIFDRYRELFLPLFRELQLALLHNRSNTSSLVLDSFVEQLRSSSSPFELLVQTEQRIQELFVRDPIKKLQAEWMDDKPTPLRMGSPQEKFHVACQRFDYYCHEIKSNLDTSLPQYEYISHEGMIIAAAYKSIGLQYLSEKMGFSPPLLSDFERKMQTMAFQQLITFLGECETQMDVSDPDRVKQELLASWAKDISLLRSSGEEVSVPFKLVNELEVYFNSRFFAFQPRSLEKAG